MAGWRAVIGSILIPPLAAMITSWMMFPRAVNINNTGNGGLKLRAHASTKLCGCGRSLPRNLASFPGRSHLQFLIAYLYANRNPPPFLHTVCDQKLEAGTVWERERLGIEKCRLRDKCVVPCVCMDRETW